MFNVLILDVYPNKKFRISKDQNGGFGTANDYGSNPILKLLSLYIKKNVDYPPLHSVMSAGQLEKNKFNVEYSRKLDPSKKYDLYIVPSSIVCHETEVENIKKIKEINNKNKVLTTGPFASSFPQNYIKAGSKVIAGEPDIFFLTFKNENLSMFDDYPDLIQSTTFIDLDELYLPAWDIILKHMKPKMKMLGKGLTLPIYASRGCPYSCFYYCTYPLQQGRKLRLRSSSKIVAEMLHWHNKYKVKNFIFRDPVFSINKKHTLELLKKIADLDIKFNLCVETHLKNIDDELLEWFIKAGIKIIYVGIESANEEVLANAHRATISHDKQFERVNKIEKSNIKVKCMYILGYPSDTENSFKKTIQYSKKLLSSYAQYSVFTPYPGTPVFEEYKSRINTQKFEDFNQWQLVFEHKNFNNKDVRKLLNKAYLNYYLNPLWVFKFISSLIFK